MKNSFGIAMGSGTDVARESADVILIGSDLSKLVETLRLARRCRGIIMQNFVEMAVIIQEIVGQRRGDRFYPDVSGVASVNYQSGPEQTS